jgi:hypothetical protein
MRHLATVPILVLVAACGGGDSDSLRVTGFSAKDATAVRLDQALVFTFSHALGPEKANAEFVRIVGPDGPARGTFERGRFLVDPDTDGTVVIDPDRIGADLLARIERRGEVDLVPDSIRYDLGFCSPMNGRRRVLFDRRRGNVLTFVPDLPWRPDLSDSGLTPGAAYEVSVRGTGFRSTFAVVPADSPEPFAGETFSSPWSVVQTDPWNGSSILSADASFRLRFPCPLDPGTVLPGAVGLRIASVPGRPVRGAGLQLRQSVLGPVEIILTPHQDLAPNQIYLVTLGTEVRDFGGRSVLGDRPFLFCAVTAAITLRSTEVAEGFDTNAKEDAALTTASWNGTIPGALVASTDPTSVAVSRWYDQSIVTPNYGPPEIDLDLHGGTIDVLVQAVWEDVELPGEQPMDPDLDPLREWSTDWLPISRIDEIDNHQYLRFRVEFTLPATWAPGDALPIVRSIHFPVSSLHDCR